MSNQKKPSENHFTAIYDDMLYSDGYSELTNAARVAYLLLKSQCYKSNQKSVKFSYNAAQRFMTRHTFSRAVKQLVEVGFVDKSQQGGLTRRSNVYTFSERWRKWDIRFCSGQGSL